MGIIGIPGLYNFLSSCLLIKGLLITVFIYSAERNSSLFGEKSLNNFSIIGSSSIPVSYTHLTLPTT